MKRWSDELFLHRPRIDRSTYATRKDPLDSLRCASLYLIPAFGSNSATPSDELEGLKALKHFINISTDKVTLAYRRNQALKHAIEIAAKHEMWDEAWKLAILSIEGPNYLFPSLDTCFVLFPYFGPYFISQAPYKSGTEEHPNWEKLHRIRDLYDTFTDEEAKKVSDEIEKWLKDRLEKANKVSLKKMAPYLHLREFERTARREAHRSGNGMDGAVRLRDGVDLETVIEAEKKIGCTLPDEYKRLVQVANGWEGAHSCFISVLSGAPRISHHVD